MDGCTKGPQLEEGENLNTGALGTGRTPPRGTSAPAGQAQGGPSPAFVKENIDVLRTMIKELDNRGQEKVTPRKLFNEESGEAGSKNSQTSPSAEEVGGYSSDGSSRSRSRGRLRSARKNQKNVSKKKGITKSHRSVRSEARSKSKSKSVKSKPQPVRASRRKSSSDSGYDTASDSGSGDLSMPYRRPKPIPPNVRVYEGNKDPEDRLSIFSAVAEQEEWPMPVWCKMFRQTLSGSARNWFDSLDPKSVDGFEERSSKFLEEFSQQKKDRVRAFIKGETATDTTEATRSPRWEKSAGKASWSENQNRPRNRSHRRGKEETWGPVLLMLEEKASHF
ncbi:hypothetical protein Tco_1029621 [Tanacetum coccineum]|uniref:Reverse transcriptase domain-containing protein n=1 Tax=Tanacetum coccineum TaxID=301880 RepID=A0ABQ5G5C1_9ASTR